VLAAVKLRSSPSGSARDLRGIGASQMETDD
jgi:hypothetical protein